MNVFDRSFGRKEAVQKSAEILRDMGTAFFPLDVKELISAFGTQINLVPYAMLENNAERMPRNETGSQVSPQMMSRDGFCTRVPDTLFRYGNDFVEGSIWYVYYDDTARESRIRFTLMHELGHIALSHHYRLHADTLIGMGHSPEYKAADRQADLFSINLLAPAPAAYRVLKEHGFTYIKQKADWQLTDPNAPFLRNLGSVPHPEVLIMTAFGLSQSAANIRMKELPSELEIWKQIDPELYMLTENLPFRAGWFCRICHARRRTTLPYCPGCGKGFHYEFRDLGGFSRPVINLSENGQFEFCSVCGNSDFPEDAEFCPVCGNPVINECENALYTDGDFIRSGMEIVRGTHHCKPSDIFCGTCGVLTTFGRRHGPRKNMWLPTPTSERCRVQGTHYPDIIPDDNGKLHKCPACGSIRSMRDGCYCADCKQPLQNVCAAEGRGAHSCGINDRYCRICGKPTIFKLSGWLPEYRETETFAELKESEKHAKRGSTSRLMIQPDGKICVLRHPFADSNRGFIQ